jgi:hypothetical protein
VWKVSKRLYADRLVTKEAPLGASLLFYLQQAACSMQHSFTSLQQSELLLVVAKAVAPIAKRVPNMTVKIEFFIVVYFFKLLICKILAYKLDCFFTKSYSLNT